MVAFLYHVWFCFPEGLDSWLDTSYLNTGKPFSLRLQEILVHFRSQVGIPVDLDQGVLKMVLSELKLSPGWSLPSPEDFL